MGHDSYPNFTGYPAFHKDLDSGKYLQLDGNSAQSSDSTYFPSGAAHADYIKLGSVFADTYGYGGNLEFGRSLGLKAIPNLANTRATVARTGRLFTPDSGQLLFFGNAHQEAIKLVEHYG